MQRKFLIQRGCGTTIEFLMTLGFLYWLSSFAIHGLLPLGDEKVPALLSLSPCFCLSLRPSGNNLGPLLAGSPSLQPPPPCHPALWIRIRIRNPVESENFSGIRIRKSHSGSGKLRIRNKLEVKLLEKTDKNLNHVSKQKCSF